MAAGPGGALAREQTEQMLGRATEFDQEVGGLAASLIHVPLDTIDAQIVHTLGTVAELLEADRASRHPVPSGRADDDPDPSVGADGDA